MLTQNVATPQIDETKVEDKLGTSLQRIAPYSIRSYGADYTVDSLVKRMREGKIFVPAFQRKFVWDMVRASRFIESLLLGLPVPGIFLSRDRLESHKLIVIDGQQRLSTVRYFYDGTFADGREFSLKNVQKQFVGRTYQTLDAADQGRLDDYIIHATIIEQVEPIDGDSSIYHIFQRLNTGAVPLQPQEIRSAIYSGEFQRLLERLNDDPSWRSIYGPKSQRKKDQELILRFLALYFNAAEYRKPMDEFLNNYMSRNSQLGLQSAEQLSGIFQRTIGVVHRCIGERAFRLGAALNAAVFDAVTVGLARRLEHGNIGDCDALATAYNSLLGDPQFLEAVRSSTSNTEKVNERVALATQAFAEVK